MPVPFDQQVDTQEAIEVIYHALEANSTAYGLDATQLSEWLIEAILNDEAATKEMLQLCKNLDVVRTMCDCIANE